MVTLASTDPLKTAPLPDWVERLEFDRYTKIAVHVALVAGKILEDKQGGPLAIMDKPGAGNVVTDVDLSVEKKIIQIISATFPDHGILAEETLSDGIPTHEYIWVIDPLDGSKNYSKGVPIYSVSIALLHRGRPISGVIFAPSLKQLFVANGQNAYLNGKPISVTKTNELRKALLASGYPYAVKDNPLQCMEVENAMIQTGA